MGAGTGESLCDPPGLQPAPPLLTLLGAPWGPQEQKFDKPVGGEVVYELLTMGHGSQGELHGQWKISEMQTFR